MHQQQQQQLQQQNQQQQQQHQQHKHSTIAAIARRSGTVGNGIGEGCCATRRNATGHINAINAMTLSSLSRGSRTQGFAETMVMRLRMCVCAYMCACIIVHVQCELRCCKRSRQKRCCWRRGCHAILHKLDAPEMQLANMQQVSWAEVWGYVWLTAMNGIAYYLFFSRSLEHFFGSAHPNAFFPWSLQSVY